MNDPIYPGQAIEIEAFVQIVPSALAAAVQAGATTITVFDASRWSNGDTLKIDVGDPQLSESEIVTVSGAPAGRVVTLSAPLAFSHGLRTPVRKLSAATMAGAIQRSDGTETALTLNSVSTGRYRANYTTLPADSGANTIEVNATGAAIAAGTLTISVLADLV